MQKLINYTLYTLSFPLVGMPQLRRLGSLLRRTFKLKLISGRDWSCQKVIDLIFLNWFFKVYPVTFLLIEGSERFYFLHGQLIQDFVWVVDLINQPPILLAGSGPLSQRFTRSWESTLSIKRILLS